MYIYIRNIIDIELYYNDKIRIMRDNNTFLFDSQFS
jgi:hypothetical protein